MAKVPFLTPVGRLVQGDCWVPNDKDMQGNPLKVSAGPNMGQDKIEYILKIAVRKDDPDLMPFLALIYGEARKAWPQWFNGPAGWPDNGPSCTHPNMSLKWQDGDGLDGNGQPNSKKEGFAGCIIISTKSAYPPKVFIKDHYAPHEEVKDQNAVKRGYFIRIGGMMESNGFPSKPGMKLYCGQVALWGMGQEIISGPDAATVFGGAGAGAAIPGMSALPQGFGANPNPLAMAQPQAMQPVAAPLAMPGMQPGAPTGFAQPAAMAGMPGSPMAAPLQPVQAAAPNFVTPNPGLLAGPGGMPGMQPQPAAQPMQMPGMQMAQPQTIQMPGLPGMQPMQPAAPVAPTLTALGQQTGMTYAQMLAAGYAEAQLRQAGYIV